jgi:hypothetical protein
VYDLVVHVSPDPIPRPIANVSLARRCLRVGIVAFPLKSDPGVTAGSAAVDAIRPGVDPLDVVALNSPVGGSNPVAMEIAARVVWVPTVGLPSDAVGPRGLEKGVDLPVLPELQIELSTGCVEAVPIAVLDDAGGLRPPIRAVMAAIARHGLVLATGDLPRNQIFATVAMVVQNGVKPGVVRHSDLHSPGMSASDRKVLPRDGALLEPRFATACRGRPESRQLENIRACGPGSSFPSKDLRHMANRRVENRLAPFADRLLDPAFDQDEIHAMAIVNTQLAAA